MTLHQVHKVVDAILLTFDQEWHNGLLYKIMKFLLPTYYLFIMYYVTDRHFPVRFSSLSDKAVIYAGVTQRGILSIIFYNAFVIDQPTTPNPSLANYANDKKLILINQHPLILLKISSNSP